MMTNCPPDLAGLWLIHNTVCKNPEGSQFCDKYYALLSRNLSRDFF